MLRRRPPHPTTWPTIEALCRAIALAQYERVVETASHASATYDPGERRKKLRTLAASPDPLDRYAAALVAAWDTAT